MRFAILEAAKETACELGISERDALALEFCALAAWAEITGKRREQVIMTLAAQHAAGTIDGDTMRAAIAILDSGHGGRVG